MERTCLGSNEGDNASRSTNLLWPSRNYTCSFCKRQFNSAQALGGHMNVHRRDRAMLIQLPSWVFECPNPNPKPNFSSSTSSSSSSSTSAYNNKKLLPYPYRTRHHPFLSSPSYGQQMKKSSLGHPQNDSSSTRFSEEDLMKKKKIMRSVVEVEEFNKGFAHEYELEVLKKSSEVISLDLEIGCKDPNEVLDLELRLGCF